MHFVRLGSMVAIALFALTSGCSGQDLDQAELGKSPAAQKTAGYGFEFIVDPVGQSAPQANGGQAATPVAPNGRLTPEGVQEVVRGHFPGMKACYDAALANDPNAQGTIAVRLVIHEDGSVDDAKRESSTINDAAMVGCVVDVFEAIAFPVSSGGEATVIYPLQFGQTQ
jgi:hypothetical protein